MSGIMLCSVYLDAVFAAVPLGRLPLTTQSQQSQQQLTTVSRLTRIEKPTNEPPDECHDCLPLRTCNTIPYYRNHQSHAIPTIRNVSTRLLATSENGSRNTLQVVVYLAVVVWLVGPKNKIFDWTKRRRIRLPWTSLDE
jgi:hypothetical protein